MGCGVTGLGGVIGKLATYQAKERIKRNCGFLLRSYKSWHQSQHTWFRSVPFHEVTSALRQELHIGHKVNSAKTENCKCLLASLTIVEKFPNGVKRKLQTHNAHIWPPLCSPWSPCSCYNIQMTIKLLIGPTR